MLTLAATVIVIILALLIPCLIVARYLEWREWDTNRRIDRLRDRRTS